MTKKNLNFKNLYLPVLGTIAFGTSAFLGLNYLQTEGLRNPSSAGEYQTAYEAWADLQYSGASFNAKGILVNGEAIDGLAGGVTFGAEKEASSSLLTRVMSPNTEYFLRKYEAIGASDKETFLKDFLSNYAKDANGYRTYKNSEGLKVDLARDVVDKDGNPKLINLENLKALDVENSSLEQLDVAFKELIEQMDDRIMTFIKPQVRMKMFDGRLPGLPTKFLKDRMGYTSWKPNFGKSERFLVDAHGHGGGVGGGWEINFKPQGTYGEFEEMVAWFRDSLAQVIKDPETLERKVKLFQAPGHQRLVFIKHPELNEAKLSEFYRTIQSYIVLKGIQGNSGIESANYKMVQPEANLIDLYHGGRGVVRTDGMFKPWINENVLGIEFRAGVKNLPMARFYQTSLAARIAANDFSGIAEIGDYNLNASEYQEFASIKRRFPLGDDRIQRALDILDKAGIKKGYRVQFWGWTQPEVSFMGPAKRKIITDLTRNYIDQVSKLDIESSAAELKAQVRQMNKQWVSASKLIDDLENYMRPKNVSYNQLTMDFKANAEAPNRVANQVDVNKIDLGIEYSGKFPLRLRSEITKDRQVDGKKAWIQTMIDLSSEDREAVIKSVANDLFENLGGNEAPVKIDSDGHGHGLDVAYALRDSQGRKWQVEWDGIGRSYTPEGEIIEGSARGGTIELITPKFVPTIDEMSAVYKAFETNNVLPALNAGGGHVNIDLAAFDGNPKALARFLTIFHEHRGVIALMNQHINRSHTSEPVEVSDTLKNALKDFNGSEEELKKLLYNERYFNTRFGRKTRYIQLDVSAYYQDVIPEEFVTDDFDISNPTTEWRRTFRVDPKIRKAEFRMFNAPRDAAESALQVKLVRAMLDKALNRTDELSGEISYTTHQDYVAKPTQVEEDLKKMCDDLGLDINDFRTSAMEGLSISQVESKKIYFRSLDEKMAIHPPQPGWGDAVAARSSENALNSTGREWTPGPADELNTMDNSHRYQAALAGQELRNNIVPAREVPGEFVRTNSCQELINDIL